MAPRYFEVDYDNARVVVVKLDTTAPAKVKAAALDALKDCRWGGAEPEKLTVLTPRGLTASALGKRWIGHLVDLDEAIEKEVQDADEDFDVRDPALSRATPARLRRWLGRDPDCWWGAWEQEWPYLMSLLDETRGDRAAFEKAFDAVTNPKLNAASAKMLPARARELHDNYAPDVVVDMLVRSYWVTRGQAEMAVAAV